MQYFRNQLNSS